MHALPALLLLAATAAAPSAPMDTFLRDWAETRRFLAGRPVQPTITPDEHTVLFLRSPPRSAVQTLFAFDVESGQTRELLTPAALLEGAAEHLSAGERAALERLRISARGFTGYRLSEDGRRLLVTLSGRPFVVALASGEVTRLRTGEGAVLDAKLSRDGRQVAYVRGHDVYRIRLARNVEEPVTRGGTRRKPHGVAEFVAQEEMRRYSGFWWSPDGAAIAYTEVDHGGVEELSIVDPLHPERGAERFFYPRAGGRNARVRLGLVPAAGGRTVWARWDAEAYPYLASVVWPKQGPLTLLVQNRAQTEEVLLAVDVRTGRTRALLTERDEAWLNLEQAFPRWLEDGSGFLWYTERHGGPEVELRGADGALVRSWVRLATGAIEAPHFVDAERTLYFSGGPDVTQSALWRVREGGLPERVPGSAAPPAHETGVVSRRGGLHVLTTQGLAQMPHTRVVRADGRPLGPLPSVAEEPSLSLQSEVRAVGPQRFQAQLVRPRAHPPGRKLPTLVRIYGGPTNTVVRHAMAENLLHQWVADQGFLVVKFDVRGTPGRGAAWERAVKHDFATVPLADQVAALRALAAEVPEVDLERVGIEGWSFGGYLAALAVLRHGDVFRAAVAGAPVVDWRDYDTHYTERYLGLPREHPEAYRRSSLLTHVEGLARPLLLIHGTADDNVYFFHSLKLSDALLRAGKPHALLPLSGLTHMVPDPLVTERQWQWVLRFFRESLGGPGPAP